MGRVSMQYSQHYMEPVRTILSNEINDVVIYRSLKWEGVFFTVIFVKDRKTIETVLKLLSENHRIGSEDSDLLDINTEKDNLVLIFRYFTERLFSSFAPLILMETKSTYQAVKSFIEKCMGSELPIEFLWMAIQEDNISVDKWNQVYFNYFLDFKKLPEQLTKQQLIDKVSLFVKSILAKHYQNKAKRGKVKYPKAVELFIRKQEKGNFSSLGDIYEDVLFILREEQDKQKGLRALWARIKGKFGITNETIKVCLVGAIVLITVIYVYSELRARSIPAFLYQQETEVPVYDGVNTIGTEDLTDGRG